MNSRDMKKLLYREFAFFLNTRNQDWSSVPDWFHNVKCLAFRQGGDYGTRAEQRRLDLAIDRLILELFDKGKRSD